MNINDARVIYTEMTIREKFLELLRRKSYQSITVTELCRDCNINRATFYKHYRDIPDLLSNIEQETIDELANAVDAASLTELKERAIGILKEIKERKNAVMVLCSENGRPGFTSRLFAARYEIDFPLLKKVTEHMTPCEQNLLYSYINAGCGAVIQQWMENDMEEPVENIADFLLETCSATVRTKK